MRKLIVLLTAITITVTAFAQQDSKKYKERAEEVKKEIWETKNVPFEVKAVPAELNNESAVVIARSFEIINSAKFRFKISLFGMGGAERLKYITTLREKVKINDKNALEDYATLEYKKKLDKSVSFGFAKIYNKLDTYIGAKIIKPDGKVITVNTDEEVITKSGDKNKEGKLAISDLQVGDILDYYIRIEELQENNTDKQGPYTFVMSGEYPMLYYNVRLQLDEKVGVEYISANGAPSFKESKNADGDIVLELTQTNLPKAETSLWTMPARQRPYISLQYKFIYKSLDASTHFNRGEVKKGFLTTDLIDELKKSLKQLYALPTAYAAQATPLYAPVLEYFGGKKKIKDVPQDSVVKVLYNFWRYQTFASFSNSDININNDLNYRQANSIAAAFTVSLTLQFLEIDNDVILVCPRNGASLKNVLEYADFEGMVRVNTGKLYWLAFDDIVTRFNEVPQRYQGEPAITLHADKTKRSVEFIDGQVKIPTTPADKNVIAENLTVSFVPSNLQQLSIDRTSIQSGAQRHYDQKRLLLLEDMEKELATLVNKKPLVERLAEEKKTKKIADEYTAAFTNEKNKQKDYFKDEIKSQFEEEPKTLATAEIESNGFSANKFTFQYHSSFTMDNLVKKAGNNYIVEVGKLIGSYVNVEEKDRKRTLDIYMPVARTFVYDITINIPQGYMVKGIEELNKNIVNETGNFTVIAKSDKTKITLEINRTYAHNFEPVANWGKLLETVDAAFDFTSKKILLEKVK